ncbi:MAG: LD-carboxypeptidase [Elusimicrobia bacterium RIFOXYA2_FULL_39_19]|nr:MAG: LD-carboxypeptidase [Elusimicrobia bacterium RIFOXYA2_FULL_39_19]
MKNVCLITPSWLIKKKSEFQKGIKNIEKLGFKVINKQFPSSLPAPKEKAKEIHKAFKNKNVDVVLAQRGGYSSMKALPYINYSIIKKNPKILAGFSDLSTLLNTIYERTGLITLHSPMILNFSDTTDFTVRSFQNAVNGFPEKNLLKGSAVKVYKSGKAEGILKGGNLITLTALIGTKWETDVASKILFLEDVDEKPHSIDRYLTQWILCGKLQKVKALVLGDFRGVDNKEVFNVIKNQMKINFPVIHCPNIGHVKDKITLPVGAKVELDTSRKTLVVG